MKTAKFITRLEISEVPVTSNMHCYNETGERACHVGTSDEVMYFNGSARHIAVPVYSYFLRYGDKTNEHYLVINEDVHKILGEPFAIMDNELKQRSATIKRIDGMYAKAKADSAELKTMWSELNQEYSALAVRFKRVYNASCWKRFVYLFTGNPDSLE